jgi:hypothetical protein
MVLLVVACVAAPAPAALWSHPLPAAVEAGTATELAPPGVEASEADPAVDADGDGAEREFDCDDADAGAHPGAGEVPCDGIDQDCDGLDGTGAAFVAEDGTVRDVTATLSAGTPDAPASLALEEPGTLRLCAGAWYARLTVTADGAFITGPEGAEATVIDAARAGAPISLSAPGAALVVEGLTLTGGRSGYGGAIANGGSGTALTVRDCVLADNEATQGGALFVGSGTLAAEGLVVRGNVATAGGGLYVGSGAATLLDSVVEANEAASGGGIYAGAGSYVVARQGVVYANVASQVGGGFYASDGEVSLRDVEVAGNVARWGGGLAGSAAVSLSCNGFGGVFDNAVDESGGGAYGMEGFLVRSLGCDWGTGGTETAPDDIACSGGVAEAGLGESASFEQGC